MLEVQEVELGEVSLENLIEIGGFYEETFKQKHLQSKASSSSNLESCCCF
jgi:hypothetical protein